MATSDDIPPLFDNPNAPEVFAAQATGFLAIGDSVVVTLECGKSDYSGPEPTVARHVVARLIMPRSGAEGLAVGLFDFLKKGSENGSGEGGPSVN
ncbi:MAG TPA: hypothetical protein VLM36_12835 [Sphingomicrobium sp.]|nr:hypothetical protein [Sphingomicrobium sp.]